MRRPDRDRRGGRAARAARRAPAAAAGRPRRRRSRRTARSRRSPSVPSLTCTWTRPGVADLVERLACTLCKSRNPLDRVHSPCELGEHRSLVAGAGADVEHRLAAAQLQLRADAGHHVGLRDRLICADRKRGIVVGPSPPLRRNEALARHDRHRREHALVVDAARAQLPLDHASATPVRQRAHRSAQSTAGVTSVMLSIVASIPTVSTGTMESPSTSEP